METKTKQMKTKIIECDVRRLKEKYPDCIVLYRHEDFFEAWNEDAAKIHETLGAAVTMTTLPGFTSATFPCLALDKFLPRLIRDGCRVTIIGMAVLCE